MSEAMKSLGLLGSLARARADGHSSLQRAMSDEILALPSLLLSFFYQSKDRHEHENDYEHFSTILKFVRKQNKTDAIFSRHFEAISLTIFDD